jgi:hypothetical protein
LNTRIVSNQERRMGRKKDKTRGGWKGIKIKDLQPPFYTV